MEIKTSEQIGYDMGFNDWAFFEYVAKDTAKEWISVESLKEWINDRLNNKSKYGYGTAQLDFLLKELLNN